MDFAKKVALLRERRGLTQREVGDYVGVSRSNVTRWERGEHRPQLATIEKIAELFSVPVTYFLDDDQSALPPMSRYDQEFENKILGYVRFIGYKEAWRLLTQIEPPEASK